MMESMMSPRFWFSYRPLSVAHRELKCIGRTTTWPFDGPSIPISQRRIPIQVTKADSMMARRAVAYLLKAVVLLPSRRACTPLPAHLRCSS